MEIRANFFNTKKQKKVRKKRERERERERREREEEKRRRGAGARYLLRWRSYLHHQPTMSLQQLRLKDEPGLSPDDLVKDVLFVGMGIDTQRIKECHDGKFRVDPMYQVSPNLSDFVVSLCEVG